MTHSPSRRTVLFAVVSALSSGCLRFQGEDNTEAGNATGTVNKRTNTLTQGPTRGGTPRATETQQAGTGATQTPGGTPAPTDTPSPTPTDTPSPTPTDTPSPTPSPTSTPDPGYPKGVTENDVTPQLLFQHQAVVQDAGNFTVEVTRSTDGVTNTQTSKFSNTSGVKIDRENDIADVTIFVADAVYMKAESKEKNYTLYSFLQDRERFISPENLAEARAMRLFLLGGQYRPEEVITEGGTEFIDLGTEGVKSEDRLLQLAPSNDSVASFEGDGQVRKDDGFIQRLQGAVEYEGGTPSRLMREVRTYDVGTTSISPPLWVRTARQDDPTFSISLDDNDEFITVEHTGGQAVDTGVDLSVAISSSGESLGTFVSEGIQDSQTVYLYKDGDEENLRYEFDSKPDVQPPAFENDFSLIGSALSIELLQEELSP
jgi:hypothetical protein